MSDDNTRRKRGYPEKTGQRSAYVPNIERNTSVETLFGLNSRSGKTMSLVFLLDLISASDWGTQFNVSSSKIRKHFTYC
jgi:hypothetical protein